MATIDFTLDDFRGIIREEVGIAFDEKFQPAFDAAFEPHALAIQADFNQIHDELRDIRHELAGHGRLLAQHSAEIMELKARV